MENNRIITVVTRRTDGSFAEKFSLAINSEIESDLQAVKNFVSNFVMHGKAKWFEIYEGTNLNFGDFRAKPFYTTRED
jgi:hypothetical protein